MKKIFISASILAANHGYLNDEVKFIEKAQADSIHLDIMDGEFVPNFGIGIHTIKEISKITNLPQEAHMMVKNPELSIDCILKTNVQSISFHIEANCNVYRLCKKIQSANKKAGIAINIDTDPNLIKYMLNYLDFILIMLVHPGFSNQEQDEQAIKRVALISKMKNEANKDIKIICDGGIKKENSKELIKNGANTLVIGSGIFSLPSNEYGKTISQIKSYANVL